MLIEDWYGSGTTEICIDDISVICELLAVKHGDMELDLFSNSVLDAFIKFLYTEQLFTVFLFYVYLCAIATINK